MNRYDFNDRGVSPALSSIFNEFAKMPRDSFDNGHTFYCDVQPYAIMPFLCFEMLPNSDADLQFTVELQNVNPSVRRILSASRLEIYVDRVNYNDCWEAWNNFITRARSGKFDTSIPYVDWNLNGTHNRITTSLPYNPAHLLGIAPAVFYGGKNDSDVKKFEFKSNNGVKIQSSTWESMSTDDSSLYNCQASGLTGISDADDLKDSKAMRVSALPFVFYNKICKQHMNDNLMQSNPHWFPENENHDNILPYSATGAVSTSEYDEPTAKFMISQSIPRLASRVLASDDERSRPWLNVLQFANRRGDYFNSGSPFPDLLRGDVPTEQILGATMNWDALIAQGSDSEVGSKYYVFHNYLRLVNRSGNFTEANYRNDPESFAIGLADDTETSSSAIDWSNVHNGTAGSNNKVLLDMLNNRVVVDGIKLSMGLLRRLAVVSTFRERMARTDGSYNQMIQAMFNHHPHWHNHEPIRCGSTVQNIAFTEVVQTSASDSSPLGTQGGRAVSSDSSSTIHVHSDDFGMFMAYLIIRPDEVYSQGVSKMFSRLTQDEQYFPIMNNLDPDATLNRELYVSGDDNVDLNVFNYQERFAYYKSMRNRVSGLMSLPISKVGDIGAYLPNRLFGSTPNFNIDFVRGIQSDNEKLVWQATEQAPYSLAIGTRFRFVGPLPGVQKPADLGISY